MNCYRSFSASGSVLKIYPLRRAQMVSGLVEQLQVEALNKDVPLSTLLRRTKIAAVKLGLADAIGWVDAELNGYSGEPPEYRKVYGQAVYWNHYHGWQHLAFDDPKIADSLSIRWVMEPITSLEETLKSDNQTLMLNFSNDVLVALNRMSEMPITRAALTVGRGSLTAILEGVRSQVFEWALSLDAAGITGDGISFSREEKTLASNAPIHIGTFHGSLSTGDLSGANARINYQSEDNSTNLTIDRSLFGEIEGLLVSGILNQEERSKVLGDLHDLRDAKSSTERLGAYQRLITSAANHMTILAPFLPALAAYVGII